VGHLGLAGGILAVLSAGAAHAQPPSATFAVTRLDGADGCPDAAALDASVARILGVPLVASPPSEVRVDVEFARGPSGIRATLRLAGAREGERTLTDTGPTCAVLGRAVAVTLALILEGTEGGDAPSGPALAASAPSSSAPLPPTSGEAIATATPSAPASAGFVSLVAGPIVGAVGAPSVSSGLELELRVGRRARFLAEGDYVPPRALALGAGTVDVSLLAALVGACGLLDDPARAVHVSLCAVAGGGRLRGVASGFPTSDAATLSWLAAGGSVRFEGVVARRWLLTAGAIVEAPLHKYTFSVTNVGTAYRSAAVTAMLHLGIGVEIW
jgi:hypothetical protein